jgi:hypothetical protein
MTLKEIITLLKSNLTEADFAQFMDNLQLDGALPYVDENADDQYPIKDLVDYLKGKTTIKEVKSTEGIYPHTEYGWDGGNAIGTELFNLVKLDKNGVDAFGGPYAYLVKRIYTSLPGFAFHQYDADDSYEIIVYN